MDYIHTYMWIQTSAHGRILEPTVLPYRLLFWNNQIKIQVCTVPLERFPCGWAHHRYICYPNRAYRRVSAIHMWITDTLLKFAKSLSEIQASLLRGSQQMQDPCLPTSRLSQTRSNNCLKSHNRSVGWPSRARWKTWTTVRIRNCQSSLIILCDIEQFHLILLAI